MASRGLIRTTMFHQCFTSAFGSHQQVQRSASETIEDDMALAFQFSVGYTAHGNNLHLI